MYMYTAKYPQQYGIWSYTICLLLLCFWFESPDTNGNICGDAYVPDLSWWSANMLFKTTIELG